MLQAGTCDLRNSADRFLLELPKREMSFQGFMRLTGFHKAWECIFTVVLRGQNFPRCCHKKLVDIAYPIFQASYSLNFRTGPPEP